MHNLERVRESSRDCIFIQYAMGSYVLFKHGHSCVFVSPSIYSLFVNQTEFMPQLELNCLDILSERSWTSDLLAKICHSYGQRKSAETIS